MATFAKHKRASNEFQKKVADSGFEAIKEIGTALKKIGKRMEGSETVEQPRRILTDAVLDIAKVHARFRERALDAASKALKIVR